MVEHDVLALEGRRLKGSLVAAAQEIAGLENRKAQLRFSMEERKQEIQVTPSPHRQHDLPYGLTTHVVGVNNCVTPCPQVPFR